MKNREILIRNWWPSFWSVLFQNNAWYCDNKKWHRLKKYSYWRRETATQNLFLITYFFEKKNFWKILNYETKTNVKTVELWKNLFLTWKVNFWETYLLRSKFMINLLFAKNAIFSKFLFHFCFYISPPHAKIREAKGKNFLSPQASKNGKDFF